MATSSSVSVSMGSDLEEVELLESDSVQLELVVLDGNRRKRRTEAVLMESITLSLSLGRAAFDASLFSVIKYLLVDSNGIETELLNQITGQHSVAINRVPGTWRIVVEAELSQDSTVIRSNEVEVTIRFPKLQICLSNGSRKRKAKITLMDALNMELECPTFNATFFSQMNYLIRMKNSANDPQIVSAGTNFVLLKQIASRGGGTIRKSGYWEIQVEATLANSTKDVVRSNIVEVEVQFPHIDAIKQDAGVVRQMNATWAHTKLVASATSRQEFGFWIYYDTANRSYVCGPQIPGVVVPGYVNTHGSVSLGGPTLYHPSRSPLVDGVYYVAGFHTHTPLTHCPRKARRVPVGPSPADESWADSANVPGLVYDYTGTSLEIKNEIKGKGIQNGHNINAPSQIYTFGPNRVRTTTIL